MCASLDEIHLSVQTDIIGQQTGQKELEPDFWNKMNGVLEAELEKNFENNWNTEQPSTDTRTNSSIFVISQNEEKPPENTTQIHRNNQDLRVIANPEKNTYFDNSSKQQSRRKSKQQDVSFRFREMVLAAMCLLFLLWGYQQHQQNMVLEQQFKFKILSCSICGFH